MRNLLNYAAIIAVMGLFAACTSDYPGFDQTDSGLYYKYHNKTEDSVKAKVTDVVTMELVIKTETDSVIFDNRDRPEIQRIMDAAVRPIDDQAARTEWNWKYMYDQEALMKDFLHELANNSHRY